MTPNQPEDHHLLFQPRKLLDSSSTKSLTMLFPGEAGYKTASSGYPTRATWPPQNQPSSFSLSFGPALLLPELERDCSMHQTHNTCKTKCDQVHITVSQIHKLQRSCSQVKIGNRKQTLLMSRCSSYQPAVHGTQKGICKSLSPSQMRKLKVRSSERAK